MAEPSMLTAHTSGSARSVFCRHRRVVAAPMTTPNSPVTQVITPKIRLDTRGNSCYFKLKMYVVHATMQMKLQPAYAHLENSMGCYKWGTIEIPAK